MRKKVFLQLMSCLFLAVPFSVQAANMKPTEKLSSAHQQSKSQQFQLAGEIDVECNGLCPGKFRGAENDGAQIRCDDPLFFRDSTMKISGKDKSRHSKLYFNWLTISQDTDITFENLDISGKIQVTAKGKVTFKNCTIDGMDTNECGVEIFANSFGTFEQCALKGGKRTCIAVRDRSNARFSDCTISNLNNTGVLVIGSTIEGSSQRHTSSIEMTRCKFSQCPKFALYLYKSSKATIEDCVFQDVDGKAVFALADSEAIISGHNSKFIGCKCGAISCADSCKMQIQDCNFTGIGSSAIHAMKSSQIFISNCKFNDISGNGVNFEYSTGEISGNCIFDTLSSPAIFIGGLNANPKISKCIIKNTDHCCIAVRDKSTPTIDDVTIIEYSSKNPVISCSDFCEPIFKSVKFEGSKEFPRFMVFNDAKVKYTSESERDVICLHYSEGTERSSILCNKLFMGQFDPAKCVIIEEKIGGKLEILKSSKENIYKEFKIVPSDAEKVVSNTCCHVINICPQCGSMCKAKDISFDTKHNQLIIKCEKCKGEFLDECKCHICELPFKGLTKVFEENGDGKYSKVFEVDNNGTFLKVLEENSDSTSLTNDSTCSICLSNTATCIALPCGHKVVCDECADDCIKDKKLCPFCRAGITGFKHDFFHYHHK